MNRKALVCSWTREASVLGSLLGATDRTGRNVVPYEFKEQVEMLSNVKSVVSQFESLLDLTINNNLLISLLILAATSVTMSTDTGVGVQITKSFMNEKPYECNRNLTVTCKFKTNRTVVVWRMSNDRRKIAECSLLQHKCSLNDDYIGQYDYSADLTGGIFNLTIIHMTMQYNRRKLVCSDGSSSDSHVIKVTGADISIQQASRTNNQNLDAYGKSLTLTCLFMKRSSYSFVVWKNANNIEKIAICERQECSLDTPYAEKYNISADLERCIFNLTILNVTEKDNGRKLVCSDGPHRDSYIVTVRDYRPRFYTGPNTLTATSACVSKEMNVSFKWIKICANNGIEKEINPKFLNKNTTTCSNLSTFGNDHELLYTETVPTKLTNEGNCSLTVLVMYDNEGIESRVSLTNCTIIEEPDYKDENNVNVRTGPTNVPVIVIAVSVTIVCLVIIVAIVFCRYKRWQKKLPECIRKLPECIRKLPECIRKLRGKQYKKTDTSSSISSDVQVNIACAGILPEMTSQDLILSWSDVLLFTVTLFELAKDLKIHNF
ncbi:uncharacterized protein LOC132757784 [Ruditapes philippinarum]|uniref:uncharacterized protein LOC132757784 n=1 Tax=Ruditapes philippinarum TaxID=129788 RepID=UPI00295B21C5|nr:uncharacterized protein LOC132757784 [Ruditapes philippinarum]